MNRRAGPQTAGRNSHHPLVLQVLVLATSGLLIGCGRDQGVSRFDVRGEVTFDGQPVPSGTVLFLPDSSQGNRGPTGSAVIDNGKYDTSLAGNGTIGGPHIVDIAGFDGKANPEAEMEKGRPLFNGYQTKVELPHETTSLNFAVPGKK